MIILVPNRGLCFPFNQEPRLSTEFHLSVAPSCRILMMRSRKSSAVSTVSLGHRKFSTTRLQRQAELSLLNEEIHSSGLTLVTQGSGADSFENFSFQARSPTALSIARTETGGPPPFDAHPGSRLRGFSRASFSWTPASVRGSFVKPFDEPEGSHARHADKRYPAVKRTFTGPIDVEHAREQIQQPAIEARDRKVLLRRVYNKAQGRRAVKPGGLRGLQLASSLATAHANALLLHQATKGYERQALYVFDFDTGKATAEHIWTRADVYKIIGRLSCVVRRQHLRRLLDCGSISTM